MEQACSYYLLSPLYLSSPEALLISPTEWEDVPSPQLSSSILRADDAKSEAAAVSPQPGTSVMCWFLSPLSRTNREFSAVSI